MTIQDGAGQLFIIHGQRRAGKSILNQILRLRLMQQLFIKTYLETIFTCWDRPIQVIYNEMEIIKYDL